MALNVQKGVLTAPTVAGAQTLSLPSGFDPKAIIFWATLDAADALTHGNGIFSMGFATYRGGVVQQAYSAAIDVDNAGTSITAKGLNNTACLKGFSTATASAVTTDYELRLTSMQTGATSQVVLNWFDAPAAAIKVHYLALGGSDLADACVTTFPMATNSASQDVALPVGFGQPDLVFMSCQAETSLADTAFDAHGSLGVSKSETERAAADFSAVDGQNTMSVQAWVKARALVKVRAGVADAELDLSARANWPTDGFEVSYLDQTAAADHVAVLALKGTFQSAIGSSSTLTAGGPQDIAAGFVPKGALLWGCSVPSNGGVVDSTSTELGGWWVGATDGTNEGSAGFTEQDAAATSNAGRWFNSVKALRSVIRNATITAAPVLQGEADASFSGDNLRLTYNDLDSAARQFNYLILGDAAAAGQALTLDLADTAVITDDATVATGFQRTLADTTAITDSATTAAAYLRALADSAAITDVVTTTAALQLALADTALITDTPSPVLLHVWTLALDDVAAVTDAVVPSVGIHLAVADAAAVADQAALARAITLALADSTAISDQLTSSAAVVLALADSAGVADSATTALGRVQALADTALASDNVDTLTALFRALADTAAVTDAASTTAGRALGLADTAVLTDATQQARAVQVGLADSAVLTDVLAQALARVVALADTANLTDQATPIQQGGVLLQRAIDDLLAVTDSTSTALGAFRTLADTVAATDELGVAFALQRALADTALVEDNVDHASTVSRALEDTAALADEVQTAAVMALVLDDGIVVEDAVTTMAVLRLALTDDAAVADLIDTALTIGTEQHPVIVRFDDGPVRALVVGASPVRVLRVAERAAQDLALGAQREQTLTTGGDT